MTADSPASARNAKMASDLGKYLVGDTGLEPVTPAV